MKIKANITSIRKINGSFYLLTTILCFMMISGPVSAESVFMKDGSIFIDVAIVSDTANSISVRLKDKSIKQISRNSIMRILYTELKLGKIYVQKRDGEGVVAFLVDEDRSTYTFRKDLNKPEEFSLNRGDVLFMAEKNPSGLKVKGEIGTESVKLEWLPPYDPVKRYKLYTRKNKTDEYTPAQTSGTTGATVDNLSSNTTYYLVVRAVDREDNESEPSNELKITTKNIPPERPSGLKTEKNETSGSLTLRWDEAKDVDGTVKGYIIYKNSDEGLTAIGKSEKTEFKIPHGVSVYDIEISAFDELNSESDRSGSYRSPSVIFSAYPLLFFPTGNISRMYNTGYGFTINAGLKNIPVQKIEYGLSSSYISFDGKKELEVLKMTLIPITAYGGYHFYPTEWFSIFPFFKSGISYSTTEYTGYNGIVKETIINPVESAGVSLNAGFNSFYFTLGADYGILYESSGIKPFYEVFFGCSLLFHL